MIETGPVTVAAAAAEPHHELGVADADPVLRGVASFLNLMEKAKQNNSFQTNFFWKLLQKDILIISYLIYVI